MNTAVHENGANPKDRPEHVEGDTNSIQVPITQAEVRNELLLLLKDLELFCCDAVDCLAEMPGFKDIAAPTLVSKVLLPMYNIAKKYVADHMAAKNLSMADTASLEASNIDALMNEADSLIMRLHFKMLDCAEEGWIEDRPDSIRLPDLMRRMLRMHALAALSKPQCHLLPAPGFRGKFQDSQHAEIMSPGAKKYGSIQVGDEIEVICPGLYFQPPDSEGAKPEVLTLVRRLQSIALEPAAQIPVTQTDVRDEYVLLFKDFEPSCRDAVDCLAEMRGFKDNAAPTLVSKVLLPMYNIAKKYVADHMAAKNLSVADIASLEASNIDALMNEADGLIMRLHFKMLDCAEEGWIEDRPDSIRLPDLMRRMLRMHALAALSKPQCYLLPAPGFRGKFQDSQHAEIMSPGAKKHGRIQVGSDIEVVLPGLYFQPPGSEGAKPVVPTSVRRLLV